MSDIHGFDLALDAVRADMATQEPFDEVIVAGDIAMVGPEPQTVIDTVRAEGWTVIQGNTDYDLVEAAQWGNDIDELKYWVDHITPEGMDFLATLPFSHRIMPPG